MLHGCRQQQQPVIGTSLQWNLFQGSAHYCKWGSRMGFFEDSAMERPQTARDTSRRGAASPYNSLPGSASVLGLQARPKTAHVGARTAAEGSSRSVYVRAPRPPGTLREYAPLRRGQNGGYHQGDPGRAWQDDSEAEDVHQQPRFDSVRDSGRPMSARISVGPSNNPRKPPPMSARGRLQSDSADADQLSRLPSADEYESIYEDESEAHNDVAIFPAPNKQGFVPPIPLLQDPSPRRRPMSAVVSSSTSNSEVHAMPAIVETSPAHAPRGDKSIVNGAARSRGATLKDLAPVMSAIAGLTHETQLGKLVRQIDAVVLVLLEADACRLALHNPHLKLLEVVKPGENDSQIGQTTQNQYAIEGVLGMCAQAGAPINIPDLHSHKDVKLASDLGLMSLPERQRVSYLAVPARDKSGKVVAVISAMRLGLVSQPFDEDSEYMMELIAAQAGVAVSLCLQRQEMQSAKVHNKILVKAAVDLTSNPDLDIGSLTLLASVYAKKVLDCDSALVCLSHDHHRFLRTWTLLDADAPSEKPDKNAAPGDVQLVEKSHIPVPASLKKVVTTGSIANLLLKDTRGKTLRTEQSELSYLNIADLKVSAVFDSESLEYSSSSDSCVAVPLQTEHGGNIVGMLIATNKFGGPRKAGRGGVFTSLDEESLRDLAHIVAAAVYKITRQTDLEEAIALAPALTQHTYAKPALTEVCERVAKPLKADKVFVFTLEEDGNYLLHEHTPPQSEQQLQKRKSGRHAPQTSAQTPAKSVVRLSANSYPLQQVDSLKIQGFSNIAKAHGSHLAWQSFGSAISKT